MEQVKCGYCGAWTDTANGRCNYCNRLLRERPAWYRRSRTLLGFSLLLWAVIILILAIAIFAVLSGMDFFG